MCIDVPESTTNSLSSGLILDGEGRHHFPVGEKKVDLCFSTLLREHIALAILSLLETDPQILEPSGYADEGHLGKSHLAIVFGLYCWLGAIRLS